MKVSIRLAAGAAIGTLLLLSAPLLSAPASAQKVDISTITCKAFFEDDKGEGKPMIMMWLDGYYSSEDDAPVIDFDAMKAKMEKLAAFCAKNPTIGLITAAEPIFTK